MPVTWYIGVSKSAIGHNKIGAFELPSTRKEEIP